MLIKTNIQHFFSHRTSWRSFSARKKKCYVETGPISLPGVVLFLTITRQRAETPDSLCLTLGNWLLPLALYVMHKYKSDVDSLT